MENLGLYLLIAAAFLIIALAVHKTNNKSGSGGVTVGRDNLGPITVTNITPLSDKKSLYMTVFQIIIGIIGVIGVYFTIWPIK